MSVLVSTRFHGDTAKFRQALQTRDDEFTHGRPVLNGNATA